MTTPAPASKPGRPFTLPAPTWSYGQRAALSFLTFVIGASLAALNETGFWPAPLPQTSHPYKGPGSRTVPAGDFSGTHVGDDTDTSPYNDTAKTPSISTQEYLRNMNILIRSVAKDGKRFLPEDPTAGEAR